MKRLRSLVVGLGVLGMAGLALAQEVDLTCEQKLEEAIYKQNMTRMTLDYMQNTLARELRQTVESKRKAEQAQAKAVKPPTEQPGVPPEKPKE